MTEPSTKPDVGLELVNPVAGTTLRFTATAASTDGGYVELEATYPPNSPPPPRHLHPSQDEDFTVLAGLLHTTVDDTERDIEIGNALHVPRGSAHQMGAGDEGAVFRWRTTPALRTDEMFCALWDAARVNDWAPTPLQLFEVISQYDAEFCLC